MPVYHFPGYPSYLDAAAAEVGRPEAAGPARRVSSLATISNLCAQAALAAPGDVDGILAKAAEACDQLGIAHRAARLMISDVRDGRGLRPDPTPEPLKTPADAPRRPKASRTSA